MAEVLNPGGPLIVDPIDFKSPIRVDGNIEHWQYGYDTDVQRYSGNPSALATAYTTEPMAAGTYVNLYHALPEYPYVGTLKARIASSDDPTKPAHGYILYTQLEGANTYIYLGGINDRFMDQGFTPGPVWLSTNGLATQIPPSEVAGTISQYLGMVLERSRIQFEPEPPILMANAISGKKLPIVYDVGRLRESQPTDVIAGAVPGGATTQVQFNDAGAFGGDAGLTYDKAADTLSIGARIKNGDGTAGAPAYSFTSGPNTGIYFDSAKSFVGISAYGTGYYQFGTSTFSLANAIGIVWTPSLGAAADIGLKRDTAGVLAVFDGTATGFADLKLRAIKGADGATATPSYSFTSEPGMGFMRAAAGTLDYVVGGSLVTRMSPGGVGIKSGTFIGWWATNYQSWDVAILPSAAGVLEINSSTKGDYRDLNLRNLTATGLIGTKQGGGGQYIWNLDVADGYHINNGGRQITVGGIQCTTGGGYINCIGNITTTSTTVAVNAGNAQPTLALDTTQAGGTQHAFNWSTSGVMHWQVRDSLATYAFAAFNDSGAYLGDVLQLDRALRYVYIAGPYVIPRTDIATACGASGNRWTTVYAQTGTIQTSDARMKKDVAPSTLGLSFIESLRPISYKWVVGKNIAEPTGDGSDVDAPMKVTPIPGVRTHWGLIAQDVKQAVAAAGVDFGGLDENKEDPAAPMGLNYSEFIAPMIKAIQELSAEVKALKAQLGKPI